MHVCAVRQRTRAEGRAGAGALCRAFGLRLSMCGTSALGLLCIGSGGVAQAVEERFEWEAPRGCPGAESVLASVAELAGARPIDFGPSGRVRGRVEQVGRQWQLSLDFIEGSELRSRRFRAPSCEDLVRAAGVAIALALDAQPRVEPSGSSPSPLGEDATSAATSAALDAAGAAADARVVPVRQAVAAEPAELRLGAEAVFDAGALPDPALGVGVFAGLGLGDWTALGQAIFLPPQSDVAGASGRVEFLLFAAGLRACYVL